MSRTGRHPGEGLRRPVALLAALLCTACTGTGVHEPQGLAGSSRGTVATSTRAAPSSASTPEPTAAASRQPSSSTSPPARPGTALAALAGLTVRGRGPRTGYSRAQFGSRWPDVDRNGCDTRNDVLRRDLSLVRFRAGSDCVVATGRLVDPYTGATIRFVRGTTTSAQVQIDHVVALADAWQKGAAGWTPATRERFANDPLNLLAVGGAVNQRKGDGDAATWLPPRTAYRCAYVARQIAVKAEYGLRVTAAERDAMARVLSRCPAQPLPR